MSHFTAKCTEFVRFRLGHRPSLPRWEAYSDPPESLAGFNGNGRVDGRRENGREKRGMIPPSEILKYSVERVTMLKQQHF